MLSAARPRRSMPAVRALILHGPGDLRLEEVPDPVPGPGEVVVDVTVALTCATDAKMMAAGRPPRARTAAGAPRPRDVRGRGGGGGGRARSARRATPSWSPTPRRAATAPTAARAGPTSARAPGLPHRGLRRAGPGARGDRRPQRPPAAGGAASRDRRRRRAARLRGAHGRGVRSGGRAARCSCWAAACRAPCSRGCCPGAGRPRAPGRPPPGAARPRPAVRRRRRARRAPRRRRRGARCGRRSPAGAAPTSSSRPSAGPQAWRAAVLLARPGGEVVLHGGCPAGAAVDLPAAPLHYSEVTVRGLVPPHAGRRDAGARPVVT